MKGSHCLTDWGLLIGAEPSLHLPPLPHVPSSSSTSLCVCVCVSTRQGGGSGSPPGSAGLDGSLIVGGVVAPAKTHTVLLLVEQVGRFVGHGKGHSRGGDSGGSRGGDHSWVLHSIVELC